MDRIRVASLQYFIRPVKTFDQFRDQVEALVDTAVDYKAHLLVFPEYFTCQLLTLGNVRRPIHEQIRELASQETRFVELMTGLSRRSGLYIVGGTLPVQRDGIDTVYNHCYVFSPSGDHGVQGKLHMTRFETEEWRVSASDCLRVFETNFGRLAVAICYDVEFPEIARAAAREGAHILCVPTCTDERQGYWIYYSLNRNALETCRQRLNRICNCGCLEGKGRKK